MQEAENRCTKAFLDKISRNQEDFCDRMIAHIEKWVHHYDPETIAQSKRWKRYDSQTPKKARGQHSKGKTLLAAFWNQNGVVMVDFLEQLLEYTRHQKQDAWYAGQRWLDSPVHNCMLFRQNLGPTAMNPSSTSSLF